MPSSDQNPDAQRQLWLAVIENSAPSELDLAFLRAVEKHDVLGVTLLLDAKRELFTPELGRGLQIAAEKGQTDLVELFLNKGADVDWMAGLPLLLAVEKGHRDVARLLVKAGADEHRKNGYLVNIAAKAGQIQMMEWLFARGVEGDLLNALASASIVGKEAAVDLILTKLKPDLADGRGFSALCNTIANGHDGIARKLITHGFHKLGDTDRLFDAIVRRMDAPLLEFFLEYQPTSSAALNWAMRLTMMSGNAECLRVLLNEGGRGGGGYSPLEATLTPLFNDAAAQEREPALAAFNRIYGQGFTLEKLRETSADGTNGFLLSALAGQWDTVKAYIIAHPEEPLFASDFSTKNNLGRNVIGVLGREKKLGEFFDKTLWAGRRAETLALTLRSVPERFHADIRHAELTAAANHRIIDETLAPKARRRNNP